MSMLVSTLSSRARVSGGETYDLVQTLRGTETGRAGADDEDIDVAGLEISEVLRTLRARLEQQYAFALLLLREQEAK